MKTLRNSSISNDGLILNIASGDLGNAVTRYTYVDLSNDGFLYLTCQHIITATTLTIEGTNFECSEGTTISAKATSTDGTGATIVSSVLNTTHNFSTDTDLIGCYVRIVSDTTTSSNVGLVREITGYTGATGTITLSSALGATTSGVTEFQLFDNPNGWSRRVSDPIASRWTDVTNSLTGAASHTASGMWIISAPIGIQRIRIKRVTTNATNALQLLLTRAS